MAETKKEDRVEKYKEVDIGDGYIWIWHAGKDQTNSAPLESNVFWNIEMLKRKHYNNANK